MTNAAIIPAEMSFIIPVLRWAAWSREHPQLEDASAGLDLQYIDALTRRRLGKLARMALHVAGRCIGDVAQVRTVFASRHGELHRTMDMLAMLARAEPLSPTAFGLSVHNAAAGIFSIARHDRSSATALAAGEDTFTYALLEAHVQIQSEPGMPVLVVYADEPLPQEYSGYASTEEHPHALALLVSPDATRRITVSAAKADSAPSNIMQSLAFLRSLPAGNSGTWTGERHTWRWH